jgi:hypothetical protein
MLFGFKRHGNWDGCDTYRQTQAGREARLSGRKQRLRGAATLRHKLINGYDIF